MSHAIERMRRLEGGGVSPLIGFSCPWIGARRVPGFVPGFRVVVPGQPIERHEDAHGVAVACLPPPTLPAGGLDGGRYVDAAGLRDLAIGQPATIEATACACVLG